MRRFLILLFLISGLQSHAQTRCSDFFSPQNISEEGIENFINIIKKRIHPVPSKEHILNFFENIDQRMPEMQNQALLQTLQIHGASPKKNQSARDLLSHYSRENLKRLLGPELSVAVSAPTQRELAVVERLHFVLVHKSHFSHGETKTPLISGKAFADLGIPAFATNSTSFPVSIGSDAHLSFGPRLSFISETAPEALTATQYGQHTLIAKSAYSKTHGWITPYMMTEADYHNFQKITNLESSKDIHRFDFTLPDFEVLYKRQLLLSLTKLRKTHSHQYRKVMKVLEKSEVKATEHMAYRKSLLEIENQLILTPLGLGNSYWEGRIPYALPADQFFVIE